MRFWFESFQPNEGRDGILWIINIMSHCWVDNTFSPILPVHPLLPAKYVSSFNLVCVSKQRLWGHNISHYLSNIYSLDPIRIVFRPCCDVHDPEILYRGCTRLSCFINPIYSSSLEEINIIKPSKQYTATHVQTLEKWRENLFLVQIFFKQRKYNKMSSVG